jgi:hypothetical protein
MAALKLHPCAWARTRGGGRSSKRRRPCAAQRIAEPNIGLGTVGAASRQVNQRVTKRYVFAGGDVGLRDREADLASPAGEPVLSSLGFIADGSQRGSKIELNQILVPVRRDSGAVFG